MPHVLAVGRAGGTIHGVDGVMDVAEMCNVSVGCQNVTFVVLAVDAEFHAARTGVIKPLIRSMTNWGLWSLK